jgi:hypothetical protein
MRVTAAMVGRQVRFAARSALHLARVPESGKEFPRLLATRGRSTMVLRSPWLPFRLIDAMSTIVDGRTRVFEYGGGGSTLWFLDRGAEVVTVEHHHAWAESLRSAASHSRWTLLERGGGDDFQSYVRAIDGYADDWFDIVLVDGRERVSCMKAALTKVKPGGLLIVDDSDRACYAAGLAGIPWSRQDYVGFAPAKPTLAYTTVFTRPS